MIGKQKMMLVCSGISDSGEYTHYTFSTTIKVVGPGIHDEVTFSINVMRNSNEPNEPSEYKYGKSYEFTMEQV